MSMIDTLLNLLGWDEENQKLVEQEEAVEVEPKSVTKRANSGRKFNNHKMGTYNFNTLNVLQPKSLGESREVSRLLKMKQPIVLNIVDLENINRDLAQRIMDFVSGAVDALYGDFKKISSGIFIITPNGINIEENEDSYDEAYMEESDNNLRWMN